MALESVPGNMARGRADSVPASALVSRLLDDATALVRNELARAKAEMLESANTLKQSIIAMAAGGIVLFCGALALVAAAVLALALVMAAWAAALIVGAILAIAGFVMVQSSKKKLADPSLKLQETRESLRKDAAVAARRDT